MSAETMKMPEPIIDPATIIVESSRPRPRMKPVDSSSTTALGWAIDPASKATVLRHEADESVAQLPARAQPVSDRAGRCQELDVAAATNGGPGARSLRMATPRSIGPVGRISWIATVYSPG